MKPEDMPEETWILIVREADANARFDFVLETATFVGLHPNGQEAWFKAIGKRKVLVKGGQGLFADVAEFELQDDWFYVHLPARCGLDETQEVFK